MKIIRKTKNNKLYYQIKDFNIDNHMSHLFSSRIGWEQDKLHYNISEILNNSIENIYSVKQVHGINVKTIKDQDKRLVSNEEYDGLITNKKNIVLSTYHADCVAIYFYDKNKGVIGLAHGGWKGTLNNICKTMVLKMKEEYACKLEDILVAIGPSIGPCCYEIKEDVASLFEKRFLNRTNILINKENKIYLSLWQANKENLLDIGIRKENIISSEFCTSCNIDTLYSYRKENGTRNRMVGAIVLKK